MRNIFYIARWEFSTRFKTRSFLFSTFILPVLFSVITSYSIHYTKLYDEYGVTLHYMREKVDAGEILGNEKFPIDSDETGLSLLLKCYKHGARITSYNVCYTKLLRNLP